MVVYVSYFKEKIGLLGLVAYLLGVGLFLGLAVAIRAAVGLGTVVGGEKVVEVSGLARPLASAALLLMFAAFLPTAAWVGYEAVGPPEGYIARGEQLRAQAKEDRINRERCEQLRQYWADLKDRAQKADQVEKARVEAEEAGWSAADFVLVNPTHRAVAVKVDGDTFRVTARAADNAAQQRLQQLWAGKMPVIGNDPALARKLYDAYTPNTPKSLLVGGDREEVRKLAGFRALLPADASLVSFEEVGGRKRVGHQLKGGGPDSFVFCELVPKPKGAGRTDDPEGRFEAELVTQDRLVPGTKKQLAAGDLATAAGLLDRWHYEIADTLQGRPPGSASMRLRPVVYIDEVAIEQNLCSSQVQRLKSEERRLQLDLAQQLGQAGAAGSTTRYASGLGIWMAGFLDAMEQAASQRQLDKAQHGVQQVIDGLRKEREELTALGEAGGRLTRDLRQRFLAAGFPVLDRSGQFKDAFYTLTGLKWDRPDAATAVSEQLVQATHLLLTELGQPEATGTYHLTMRLVDIHTSEILWMQHADFTDPNPPELLRQTDLAGIWRAEGWGNIRIIEPDRKTIRVELDGKTEKFAQFSMTATRDRNKLTATGGYHVYVEDKGQYQHPAPDRIELLADGRLRFMIVGHSEVRPGVVQMSPHVPIMFSRVADK